MAPLLTIEGVSCFYEDFQALFDVSLHVDEGETVAVIGANGAGKSTLLASVAGLLRPAQGRVLFEGRAIERRPAYRRARDGIGLVPEGRRIFPSLTVDENLRLGAYPRRRGPWDVARVYELFPPLAALAARSGGTLSGGEQQMCAIGRALMANPRLLLLDELSLGLAPRSSSPSTGRSRRSRAKAPASCSSSRTSGRHSPSPIARTACSRRACLSRARQASSRGIRSSTPISGSERGLGQRPRPGHPPRRPLRPLRRRALARVRCHAHRQPRPRRPDRPERRSSP